jgi:hypothetical protein
MAYVPHVRVVSASHVEHMENMESQTGLKNVMMMMRQVYDSGGTSGFKTKLN